jgi:hypothetical protein
MQPNINKERPGLMGSDNAITLWDIWHGTWVPDNKTPEEPATGKERYRKSVAPNISIPPDFITTEVKHDS